jgi:hypothetical protein
MPKRGNNIPGFIHNDNKIIPAGSWCCKVMDNSGRSMDCLPIIRTNSFFAGTLCGAHAVTKGFPRSTLVPCPQDYNTCCSAVGCNAKYDPIITIDPTNPPKWPPKWPF